MVEPPVIYIVGGAINAGKTTWLQRDWQGRAQADGFVCRKVFADSGDACGNEHIGYDLERLSDNRRCPFIRKPGHQLPDWQEVAFLAEKYSFSAQGFIFAEQVVNEALANGCERFYFDEIGPLELQKRGFYLLLSRLLRQPPPELLITIRSHLIEPLCQLFNIQDYQLVNIT